VLGFTNLDFVALAFFLIAWIGYHAAVELTPAGQKSLNKMMNGYRYRWMEQMVVRENRIVDTTIMASLMNGTAFFASTSLIAIALPPRRPAAGCRRPRRRRRRRRRSSSP